jgi:hypothetical protein
MKIVQNETTSANRGRLLYDGIPSPATCPAWPTRASTDRALRVLREGRGRRRVARLEDIQVEVLMLELRDLVAARGDRPTGRSPG